MSSPLSIFRRNQRTMIVGLTVLAMFAFVVLPSVQTYLDSTRGAGAASNATLATIGGEQIDAGKMDRYVRQHQMTTRFLRDLGEKVMERGGRPRVPGFFAGQDGTIQRVGISSQFSRENALRTYLLSKKAKLMGFSLDDSAIDDWMRLYANDKVESDEMYQMLGDASENQMGRYQLYSVMKTELLANMLERVAQSGIATGNQPLSSPGESWDLFKQMNLQALVDTYALPVSAYVDQVSDSDISDAEISDLFEQYKDTFPDPDRGQIGFRKFYSANVAYLTGSLDGFLDIEKQKFSEEELRKEYDRLVEAGRFKEIVTDVKPVEGTAENPEKEGDESAPAEESSEDPKPADDAAPENDTQPTSEPKEEEPAAKDAPAETEPPAEPETEATETGENESTGDEPSDPEPTENGDDAEPAATDATEAGSDSSEEESEDAPAPKDDESGRRAETTTFQLTAYRPQEAGDQDETDSPESSESGGSAESESEANETATETDASESNDPAQPETPTDNETAEAETPEATQPANDPAEATDDKENAPSGLNAPATPSQPKDDAEASPQGEPATTDSPADDEEPENSEDLPEAPATPEPPEMRVQTFEEVKDQVAQELALPKAREALQAAMSQALKEMKKHLTDRMTAESEAEIPTFNLQETGEALGLQYGETGMQDPLSIADQPIGSSQTQGMGFGGGDRFPNLVYNDRLPNYAPQRTDSNPPGSAFVFWKIEQEPARTPSLDEVIDQVKEALKSQKALELAKAEADKLVASLSEGSDKKLIDEVPENKQTFIIEDVGPFTAMQGFGLSVPQLDRVGESFMSSVFKVPQGGYTSAVNDPQTVVYVVNVKELSPDMEKLREDFMQPAQRMRLRQFATFQSQQLFRDWYVSLEKDMNVQWSQGDEQ